ncbi:hypothetical protein CEX98_21810 [Pseudoalteromonas piscicida]|uniref:Uncharacterized protein n=1 Tax=Pseudoalteromonas piscicida TaxID=43662 RepID=A0A2A5JJR0_PSEO7|nr:hypothetical protein CEX98_21810 [Pseudoalteromonas piscicida]
MDLRELTWHYLHLEFLNLEQLIGISLTNVNEGHLAFIGYYREIVDDTLLASKQPSRLTKLL